MDNLKVYCDGGARGNPGPAGVGVVIINKKNQEKKFKKYLGIKTNNQAEYGAVFFALKIIKKSYPSVKKFAFFLDSELVVQQLCGKYKVKNKDLGRLLIKIRNFMIKNNFSITFSHVKREENHRADKLVNEAIDGRII